MLIFQVILLKSIWCYMCCSDMWNCSRSFLPA